MTNADQKGGISACQKSSELRIVGDGVLDFPAAEPCVFADFRQIRNISQRVVQEADPYI